MKIQVKQEHIDAGEHCVGSKCPVALALNEAINIEGRRFFVDPNVTYVRGIHLSPSFLTIIDAEFSFSNLDSVSDFVCKFDRFKQVEPFEFDMNSGFMTKYKEHFPNENPD